MSEETQLFLDCCGQPGDFPEDTEWMAGADGLVIDPCQCSREEFEATGIEKAIVRNGDPDRDVGWGEYSSLWIEDSDLERAARVRDKNGTLEVVPRLEVSKAQMSYRFSGRAVGEGFSFYMPDPAAIKGWQVISSEYSLCEAVNRARELGFSTLWLHSPEAEAKGMGLALELLDRLDGRMRQVWLSGGIAEQQHLRNLANTGGAAAVVASEGLARKVSTEVLREALIPRPPGPEVVPIQFNRRSIQTG